jgi:hypothetical protein
MAFVLPKADAAAPPAPLAPEIGIAQVSRRLVAVKSFPGIVTSEEVARQRAVLLETLAKENGQSGSTAIAIVDDAEVITLQYNSPLTLPWRRRNEVAVVVTMPEPPAEEKTEAADPEPTKLDVAEAKAIEALDAEYTERTAYIRRSFEEQRRQDAESAEAEDDSQEDPGLDSSTPPPTDAAEGSEADRPPSPPTELQY